MVAVKDTATLYDIDIFKDGFNESWLRYDDSFSVLIILDANANAKEITDISLVF